MSRARTSGYGAGRLLLRQMGADRRGLLLVAVTLLLVSLVLTAWPRAVDGLVAADLRERVERLSAAQRDPSHSEPWMPWPGDVTGEWTGEELVAAEAAGLDTQVQSLAGPVLAASLGPAEVVMTRPYVPVDLGEDTEGVLAMELAMRVDPFIGDRVTVVEGREPGPFDLGVLDDGLEALPDGPPLEVMLSSETARRMQWAVGEIRPQQGPVLPIVLTGTFEAADVGDGYWSHMTSTLVPRVDDDWDAGVTVSGVGYVDPAATPMLLQTGGVDVDAWYPLELDAAAFADSQALAAQLRSFLVDSGASSELVATLDRAEEGQATLVTLLRLLAVGPIGTAFGALWLAGVLIVERRQRAIDTARARGASSSMLAVVMALQVTAVAVPAAAVGAAIGTVVVPGPFRLTNYLLPAVVAGAPAVLVVLAALRAERTRGRADLASGHRWRHAWVVEVAVLALAVLSVVAVLQRGLGPGAGSDPLVLLAPVLLAMAATVLVLRLYPLPMRWLARILHGRRGLPHFMGAAQATRRPAAGPATVAALVLGIAVMVFSAVALSTVRDGIARTAVGAVGADLRLAGHGFTDDDVVAIRGAPGVAAVVAVEEAARARLIDGATRQGVQLAVADLADLAAVQLDLLGTEPLDLDLSLLDGELPVLLPAEAGPPGEAIELQLDQSIERHPALPVARPAAVPGLTSASSWVVVDRTALAERTGSAAPAGTVLVRLAPGATAAEVLAAVTQTLGVELDHTTPADAARALREAPLVRGIELGLVVTTVVSTLLCSMLVVLGLGVAGPARRRLQALLTTLGAPARTYHRLVLWEVVPLVTVALLGGGAVGLALAPLLLGGADLRQFTGGSQPPTTVSPGVLGAVLGAFVVVIACSALGATARAGRTSAATVLRQGDGS